MGWKRCCQVLCGAKCYRLSAIGYRVLLHRFRSRRTSFNPDHTPSTAATLISTKPLGRAISRTASSLMSVGKPDDFLGQEIQSAPAGSRARSSRSEEHTSELQSRENLVCRLLLE